MLMFADIHLDPGGLIAWLVVGAVAGCLAGVMMKGGGYGLIGDVFVGLIGAEVGGFLIGIFVPGISGSWAAVGFIGSIFVAFLGACLLIFILRAFTSGRTNV